MFNNKITKCIFIVFIIILTVSLCFIYFNNKTIDGIDSIENYENIFNSVDELQFYFEENNFYGTKSPTKDLREIKRVKLNSKPIVVESKNREYRYRIIVNDEYIIYINDNFSQLWLDDKSTININYNRGLWNKEVDNGVSASLSYTIENSEILESLFEEHSQHID